MGTLIFNQTGRELEVVDCRVRDFKSGEGLRVAATKTVPAGGKHLLKKSSVDACQELHDRLGWREFHFSIAGRRPLKLPLFKLKNENGRSFKNVVLRIGPEDVLTYTTLESTKCWISNKTDTTLLIKNFFVYNEKTGAGDAGTFNAELLPRKSKSLKFSPLDIDWNAGKHWEQLEFHFSINRQEPIKLPMIGFKGNKEYVFRNRAGVLEFDPKDRHSSSCWL